MKRVIFALVATLIVITPLAPARAADPVAKTGTSAAVDTILKPVFDGMIKGDYRSRLMAAFDRSPLWKGKGTDVEVLLNQIDTAFKLYGPASTYELVLEDRQGSLWERRTYIVQHQNLVTRWQVWLVKSEAGWMIGYLSFDDQNQNWFKD